MNEHEVGCEFCGEVTEAMFLHARCHPTAPLMMARKEGDTLILSCYLPDCGREVVRFTVTSAVGCPYHRIRVEG